jgi:uncharacterized membrane protein YbhN (UPF0104 family)
VAVTHAKVLRRVVRVAAVALGVVVVVFLAQSLRRDGPAALEAWKAAHVRWTWVAFSVMCGFLGHAFYLVGWRRLLKDSGISASVWQLARMFLVSNLGRYLPGGKAWQMGIVGVMAAEYGLPAAAVAASSLLQGIVGVGVGAIVLFAAGGAAIGVPAWWLVVPVAGVAALLVLPAMVRSIPRLRTLIADRLVGLDSITAATMWTLIWTSAVSWILWGVALHALAMGLLAEAGAPLSSYIAAWSASFLAGLIAIVSPAGLGAREGAMQAVLEASGMKASAVLIVVVVARAWITILDVVPAVAVLVLRQRGLTVSSSVHRD